MTRYGECLEGNKREQEERVGGSLSGWTREAFQKRWYLK
jgi:hypothetical protein